METCKLFLEKPLQAMISCALPRDAPNDMCLNHYSSIYQGQNQGKDTEPTSLSHTFKYLLCT